MISSHDGELELLVYWTGTVSVVSHTGLGGTRAIKFGLDLQERLIMCPILLIVTEPDLQKIIYYY